MRKSQKSDNYANWNNRRHKNPSPEDMNDNDIYSFTFNPEVQPLTPKFTLDLITWHNGIDNILKQLQFSNVVLRPELSQGSRWHYHGQIKIKNIMKFFIFDLPVLRENGSFEIDTIEDNNKWLDYCKKQETKMKDLCKEYGIPYVYENDKPMKIKVQPLNDTKFTELFKLCPTSDDIDD